MIYTIKAGDHECSPRKVNIGFRDDYEWNVRFDSSCIYYFPDKEDQYDVNKLVGRGYMNGDSARFGWRWWQGQLELLAYIHDNGSITKTLITKLVIGKQYKLGIYKSSDIYRFEANGVVIPIHKSRNRIISYPMYPYFGGTQAAPHEIKIEITAL